MLLLLLRWWLIRLLLLLWAVGAVAARHLLSRDVRRRVHAGGGILARLSLLAPPPPGALQAPAAGKRHRETSWLGVWSLCQSRGWFFSLLFPSCEGKQKVNQTTARLVFLFWFQREDELMELGWTPNLTPVDPTRSVHNRWLGRQAPRRGRAATRCNRSAREGLEQWPAGLLWLAVGPIKRRGVGP